MDAAFQGIKSDGSFRFHVPVDLVKSEDGRTWVQGIASLETPDLAGETVIQKGMDLGYFLKRGFFNDNHDKATGAKVGVPTEAQITSDGLFVKGYLLDTPRAKELQSLAQALASAGGERRLGFSVEGKVLRRDGKVIQKSWIKDIAITAEPVHPGTFMEIVKSVSAEIEQNGTIEGSDLETADADLTEAISQGILKGLAPVIKALEAGHQNPPESGGSALRRQDVEKELRNLDVPQKVEDEEDAKSEGRKLTKAQAVDFVRSYFGISEAAAATVVKVIFDDDVRAFLENLG